MVEHNYRSATREKTLAQKRPKCTLLRSIDTETLIRPAQSDDIPFIYATWLRSYRNDSVIGMSTKKATFYDSYKLVIDQILNDTSATIRVMALEDSPATILGYAVGNGVTLHYCYVKESFRRLGLGKELVRVTCNPHANHPPTTSMPTQSGPIIAIKQEPGHGPLTDSTPIVIICTHKTFGSLEIFAKYPQLLYNPFALYKGVTQNE